MSQWCPPHTAEEDALLWREVLEADLVGVGRDQRR